MIRYGFPRPPIGNRGPMRPAPGPLATPGRSYAPKPPGPIAHIPERGPSLGGGTAPMTPRPGADIKTQLANKIMMGERYNKMQQGGRVPPAGRPRY